MNLKVFLIHFFAWTSISLNAGDRDEINVVYPEQTYVHPDSCYRVSFQEICSQDSIPQKSKGKYIPFNNGTSVLTSNETASCPEECQGKKHTNDDGDTCFERSSCCWKCPGQCKRLNVQEYASLECHTIDGFENVWMVRMCSSEWPVDEIRKRCQNNFPDILSQLPVLAKSGLSYKNLFCAHCNNDSHFDPWPLYAECQGRLPSKILQGGTRSILDYLWKYCDVRIASTMDILHMARQIDNRSGNKNSAENTIRDLLEDFSSKLERCLLRQELRNTVAKNILSLLRESVASYIDCKEVSRMDIFRKATTFDSIMLGMNGDRLVHWNMPMTFDMSNTSIKGRDKRWTPPSFSFLFQFHEPENKLVYSEESSSTDCISPGSSCESGEIYDPFYRSCRPVMCTTSQAFTGVSCAETVPEASKDGRSVETVSGTVTLVVEFPSKYLCSRINESLELDALSKCITAAADTIPILKDAILDNITLTSVALENVNQGPEAWTDEITELSLSFNMKNEQYQVFDDDDIIQTANNLSDWIAFERLEWKSDHVSIIVLNSYLLMNKLPTLCEQHENEKKLLYFENDYDVVDVDGHLWVYVPETYKSYPEYDYQFLDWIVSVTENGTERTFIDNSRVVVCDNAAMNVSSCHVFIPLNQTEYEVLPNGDVYLNERNTTVLRNDTAIIGGTLAICIDEYLILEGDGQSGVDDGTGEEISYTVWVKVAIWINFTVSILSLVCLLITFITYVVFQDLRTISGCCIMNLILAQFLSMTIYLFVAGAELYDDACTAVAIMLHFLFLSAFFWNNVISFDVWRTFGFGLKSAVNRMAQNRRNSTVGFSASYGKKTIYKYMMYGWGTPCVLVFIAFALDMWVDSVNVGYRYDPCIGICWIANDAANVLAFGVPVFLILFVNIIFFSLTIHSIRKFEKKPARNSKKSQRTMSVSDEVDATTQSNNTHIDNSESNRDMTFGHDRHESNKPSRVRIFSRRKNPRRSSMPIHRTPSSRARANVFTYLKMSVLMGLSWLIGFVAVFAKLLIIWFIFELFVSLNGIFIFLAFVWKKRIRQRYKYILSSCFSHVCFCKK